MKLATFKECMDDPNKIVGLRFDRVFKEVFGNSKNKDLMAYLLSVLMDKSESEILSSIKMLPEQFEVDSVSQKKTSKRFSSTIKGRKNNAN